MSEEKYGYEIVRKGDQHVATVVYLDGQEPLTDQITGDQPNYQDVVTAITSEEPVDLVRELFNAAKALQRKLISLTDRVTIRGETLYFDGDELHGALAEQIVRHFREGVKFGPLVNFLERLASNPGKDNTPEARQFVVDQSYRFIQAARLDITPEGFFVGFKGAREDEPNQFRSTWSGHAFVQNGDEIEEIISARVPSTIGTVVTMPRGEVAFNPQVSCSTGLHVGTRKYAGGFGNATLRVIVDPRDIVSVPEYEDEKMRVCRYVVDGKEDRQADQPSFDGPVYDAPYASELYTPEPADETPAENLLDPDVQERLTDELDEAAELLGEDDGLNGEKGLRNRKTGRIWVITSKRAGILRLQDPETQERMTKPVAGISKSFVKLNW